MRTATASSDRRRRTDDRAPCRPDLRVTPGWGSGEIHGDSWRPGFLLWDPRGWWPRLSRVSCGPFGSS